MRTIQTTVYTFDELTPSAQQTAIETVCDINVSHEWWESTYEDAKNVGLKITGFNLDRKRHATGRFISSAYECAYAILREHGESCETFKTASAFIAQWDALVAKYSDGKDTSRVTDENEYDFDNEADELEEDFLQSILEDYSIMLQNQYEYLQSDEAIVETIKANEYEFTEEGNRP